MHKERRRWPKQSPTGRKEELAKAFKIEMHLIIGEKK
jgi:hypothetical protein